MSITTHLGQNVDYTDQYNPGLLVREDRAGNREAVGFDMTPHFGYDRWNIYEVSFLTNNKLPVSGVGVLIYSAHSQYIVESKSLKLYFFSYNMTSMGDTIENSIKSFEDQVTNDLSALLGVDVKFKFHHNNDTHLFVDSTDGFENIDHIHGVENVKFNSFNENPSLIQIKDGEAEEYLTSSLLRSNCKVTHQPDWGDLYVYYRGPQTLDHLSFVEYLVSFRGEFHFHEEIVETMYHRLLELLKPSDLMIFAHYTRRGGLDINPIRTTSPNLIPRAFTDVKLLAIKTFRQ